MLSYLFPGRQPRELSKAADTWLQLGLDQLSNEEVRARLGSEKADRLHALAAKAGKLLVSRETVTLTDSDNGLFMFPVARNVSPHTRITLSKEGKQLGFSISELTHRIGHFHSREFPYADIICFPARSKYLKDPVEGGAIAVHELVHADELRRGLALPLPGETRAAARARCELEAYNDQFSVLDVAYGGALQDIVAVNSWREPSLFLAPALTTSWESIKRIQNSAVVMNALGMAIYAQRYNYTPDGAHPVPQPLVEVVAATGFID